MTLSIEVPASYAPTLKSGEKNMTFQLKDSVNVGDIVTIAAGPVKRQIRILSKVWVPESSMNDRLRHEVLGNLPPEEGFSGAFKIDYEYVDGAQRRPRYAEDVDRIADVL